MENRERLRRRLEQLMARCEKCRDPSICPTCTTAKRMFEISAQLETRIAGGSAGKTEERT